MWDPSKPDGQPRRRVDASEAERALQWKAQVTFRDGLEKTVEWYLTHREEAERAS